MTSTSKTNIHNNSELTMSIQINALHILNKGMKFFSVYSYVVSLIHYEHNYRCVFSTLNCRLIVKLPYGSGIRVLVVVINESVIVLKIIKMDRSVKLKQETLKFFHS